MLKSFLGAAALSVEAEHAADNQPTRTSVTYSVRSRAGHSDGKGYRRAPNRVKREPPRHRFPLAAV